MRPTYCFLPLLTLALLTLTACNGARNTALQPSNAPTGTGFITKTLQQSDHSRLYAVFIPHTYNPNEKYPVIVFLHGIGEAGSDCRSNLRVGLAPFIADNSANFKFIVIFPQSTGGWDENSSAATDVIATLDQVQKDYSIDPDRVILTGLSTGGYGTWAIGAKYKNRFAALVPMCAYSNDKDVPNLLDIPVWCFHNTGDPFVLAAGSSRMCKKISERGGNAKYTEYGALGHDCWDAAYANPELFAWMMTQRRNGAKATSSNATPNAVTPAAKSTPMMTPVY